MLQNPPHVFDTNKIGKEAHIQISSFVRKNRSIVLFEKEV
jgi:hypothetical protein